MMGMPFPTGIRLAGRESGELIPWAWAINGGTSVFSSAVAILISMTYGFVITFLVGAGAYLVALLSVVCLTHLAPTSQGE